MNRIATEADLSSIELSEYAKIHQVQINLPNGGNTVADNVWLKKVYDEFGGLSYEVIVNETKLSRSTDFTKRQKQFIADIGKPDSKFTLRNTKFKDKFDLDQGIELNVKTYIKTTGNGKFDDLSGLDVLKIVSNE